MAGRHSGRLTEWIEPYLGGVKYELEYKLRMCCGGRGSLIARRQYEDGSDDLRTTRGDTKPSLTLKTKLYHIDD
jgi:hypothetical protein